MESQYSQPAVRDVQRVETGGLVADVVVELDGGETVTSVITSGSAERLCLEVGSEVSAVDRATGVVAEAE